MSLKEQIIQDMAELRASLRCLVDEVAEIDPATERDAGWKKRAEYWLAKITWEESFSLQTKILNQFAGPMNE